MTSKYIEALTTEVRPSGAVLTTFHLTSGAKQQLSVHPRRCSKLDLEVSR